MHDKQPHKPTENALPEQPDREVLSPENLQEKEDQEARNILQGVILNVDAKKSEIQKWEEEIGRAQEELRSWEGPHHKEIWQKKAQELHSMTQKLTQLRAQLARLQNQQDAVKTRIPFLFEKQVKGRALLSERELSQAVWYPDVDGQEYSAPTKEDRVIARKMGKKGYEYNMINEDGGFTTIETESVQKEKAKEAKQKEERNVMFAMSSEPEEWPQRIDDLMEDPEQFDALLEFCTQPLDGLRGWTMRPSQTIGSQFQAAALKQLHKKLPDPRVVKLYKRYANEELYNSNTDTLTIKRLLNGEGNEAIAADAAMAEQIGAIRRPIKPIDLAAFKRQREADERLIADLVRESERELQVQMDRLKVLRGTPARTIRLKRSEIRFMFTVAFKDFPPEFAEPMLQSFIETVRQDEFAKMGVVYEDDELSIARRPPEVPDAGKTPPPQSKTDAEKPKADGVKDPAEKDKIAADAATVKEEKKVAETAPKPKEAEAKKVEEVIQNPTVIQDGAGKALQGFVNGFRVVIPIGHAGPSYIAKEDGTHHVLKAQTVQGLNAAILESAEEEIWEEESEEKPEDPYAEHRDEILDSVFGLNVEQEVIDAKKAEHIVNAMRLIHRHAGEHLPKDIHPLRALGLVDALNHIVPERADQFEELFNAHLETIKGWTFEDLMALTRLWNRKGKYEFATLIQLKEMGCYEA